jgi:hypothetical protein
MDTKVLLRLIRDDIKILENINDSFISQNNLTCEEAEVALARSRALVMEFEMLSKNLSKEEEPQLFGETKADKAADEDKEKKVHSLRNFLPFIKSEEKSASPATDLPSDLKEEIAVSAGDTLASEEPDAIKEDSIVNELHIETVDAFAGDKVENVVDPAVLQAEVSIMKNNDQPEKIDSTPAENPFEVISRETNEGKFETRPLKSIRDGIGINDRFLFIRELFHNNSEKYDQTLTTLDELAGIEDAVRFLKQNFKWSKSEAGEKFLLLIKRRFAK